MQKIDTKSPTAQKLFQFWQMVETLTPQDVAKSAPNNRDWPVYRIADQNEPFPWQSGHQHSRKTLIEGRTWRYSVQCGIYDGYATMDLLEATLPRHPDVDIDRGSKICRLFDITVDFRGVPLPDSLNLSMAGWATGHALHNGVRGLIDGTSKSNVADLPARRPDALPSDTGYADLDALQDRLREAVALRTKGFVNEADAVVKVTDREWLDELTTQVIDKCRLPAELFAMPLVYYIKCAQVASKPKPKTPTPERADDDLLNSFFINDLALLAKTKKYGTGLARYVNTSGSATEGLNLRTPEGLDEVRRITHPSHHPVGRWPSKDPLAISQQVAINAIWQRMKDQPDIFGVNGPPGTGKTTLLRDIVAAVVVDRAQRMAQFADPTQAFGAKESRKVSGDLPSPFHSLNTALTGDLIVVASCNNGAVENISLELPAAGAIDEKRLPDAQKIDYYQDIARVVIDQDAWGLIAARLGNKSNRSEFGSSFWWGKKETAKKQASIGLRTVLTEISDGKRLPKMDWQDAVKAFTASIENEAAIRRTLVAAAGLESQLDQENIRCSNAKLQTASESHRLAAITADIVSKESEFVGLKSTLEEANGHFDEHLSIKPNFLEWLSTLGKSHRSWRDKLSGIVERRQVCRSKVALENQALAEATSRQRQCQKQLEKLLAQESSAEQAVQQLIRRIDSEKLRIGGHWPDNAMSDEDRELSAPWAIEEWCAARTDVFLAALALHRAFVEACSLQMTRNLGLTAHFLNGVRLPADMACIALESLALVVPVISTTFASVTRMFGDLGSDTIGWLLIDEAGQAMPQQAAGAIWRARRTVVVGDPLQLEPVATLSSSIEGGLAKVFGIDQKWWPSQTSTQELADRTTPIGTRLPSAKVGAENGIWVGAPLRVHRRCLEPMFSISNRVAYGGLMIHAKRNAPAGNLPPSQWLDVRGTSAEGHWIVEEGEVLKAWVSSLKEDFGVDKNEIFLISPFRDVANQLRMLGKVLGLDTESRVGTVHTTQGKEADVVILVLGGNPNKHGAKDWAAKRPNLVNVAASRAKTRLYVIGNRLEWQKRDHFAVMASLLPVVNEFGVLAGRPL